MPQQKSKEFEIFEYYARSFSVVSCDENETGVPVEIVTELHD